MRLSLIASLTLVLLTLPAGVPRAQEVDNQASETAGAVGTPVAIGGTVSRAREARPRGGYAVDERVQVVVGDPPTTRFVFTDRGGTLRSAIMLEKRYWREPMPQLPDAHVPDEKLGIGEENHAIDVISTWSPRYLPFRMVLNNVDFVPEITRVARRWSSGRIVAGKLSGPGPEDSPAVDRVVVRGDTVVIKAPASVAGTYEVAEVARDGSLALKETLAVADVDQVDYEISRKSVLADAWSTDTQFVRVSDKPGLPLVYVWPDPHTDDSPVYIEKRFDAGQHPYELGLTVTVHNFGPDKLSLQPGLRVSGWHHPEVESGSSFMFRFPVNVLHASCFTGDSLERFDFKKLHSEVMEALNAGKPAPVQNFPTQTDWVGVDTQYFLVAAAPTNLRETQCSISARPSRTAKPSGVASATVSTLSTHTIVGSTGGCIPKWLEGRKDGVTCEAAAAALGRDGDAPRTELRNAWEVARKDAQGAKREAIDQAWNSINNRSRSVYRYALYLGPKDLQLLTDSDHNLRESMDFGWLGVIAETMHKLLRFFHSIAGHWGLAIVLLTLMVKLLLLPLTNRSFKQMQKMSLLKPEMDELKNKYGNDREAMQRETMALYKRHGVNPLGGCLPMLLQMPIWIALYRTIGTSVELYHAPLGLWIHDLSASDPYYVTPILLGVLMLVQSHFTTSPGVGGGAQQKLLKYGMPAMFAVFMLFLPAGLVLYILVNTTLTIIQNLIIRRRMT